MNHHLAETPYLTGAQFEAKFAQAKDLKSMSNQPKPVFKQRHVLEKEHQAALTEIADLKKGGTTRQASAELDRLKGEVATLRARLASEPAKPGTASPAKPITAAEFATKPLRMNRDEFAKLSAADKSRFSTTGGKLI